MKEKNLSLLFHWQPKLSIQEAKQQKIRNLNFDTVRSLDTGESKKCASTVSIWHPVIVLGARWTNLRGRDGAMNSSSADLWQHWAWQSHKRKKIGAADSDSHHQWHFSLGWLHHQAGHLLQHQTDYLNSMLCLPLKRQLRTWHLQAVVKVKVWRFICAQPGTIAFANKKYTSVVPP